MKKLYLSLILLMFMLPVMAQHEHHHPPKPKTPPPAPQKKAEQKKIAKPAQKKAVKPAPKATPVKKSVQKKPATPPQKKAAPVIIQKSAIIPADTAHEHLKDEGIYFMERTDTASKDPHRHHHNEHAVPPEPEKPAETSHAHHSADHGAGHEMHSVLSASVPMNRDGSGTSWMTDRAPMFMQMEQGEKWHFMLHYAAFLRYTNQDILESGDRGDEQFDSPNWMMLMARRNTGKKGFLFFRQMISLDPWTVGAAGYPLLFQTGETYKGEPLVDAQHPHDLFSEIAAGYSHSFNTNWDAFVYAGLPGEPALGPGAFMHRPSAAGMPSAPLGHHWQDASHITYGVITAGLRFKEWKADLSVFRGTEPDENRYDIEQPKLDSYSGRLTFNPGSSFSFQVSGAFLHEPELIEPGTDQHRYTASVLYNSLVNNGSQLSGALVWGANQALSDLHTELKHSFLAEADCSLTKRINLFGRAEAVQKSSHELAFHQHDVTFEESYWVNAVSMGASHALLRSKALRIDIGGLLTGYPYVDDRLKSVYGGDLLSGEVFIRLTPPQM